MHSYQQLVEHIKQAGIHASVQEILGWDEETMMPAGATEMRALQKGTQAEISHTLATSNTIGELIRQAKKEKLNNEQQAMLHEIEFDYARQKNVPAELVKQLEETTTRATEAWKRAKHNSDFKIFAPHLKKIVELKQQEAHAIDATKDPYEVLFEGYESGISIQETSDIFKTIKNKLVPLIEKISKKNEIDTKILYKKINEEQQLALCKALAQYIGFDFTKGRLDISAHPFSAAWRITTRFENNLAAPLLSTAHEAGHAAYEHNLPFEHFGTPLSQYRSLSIHESQSRLWENHVAKSKEFWKGFFPQLKKAYTINTTPDNFYKAINAVKPGLIRVNADEVTYTMHIILRFEIEKALIQGKLTVEELPNIWNKKMKEYLGVKVPDDAHGVLQDIHWSLGDIGYFGTYSLGSMIAAQLFKTATNEINRLKEKISTGKFGDLHKWLKNKIHTHGRRYTTKELIKRATGEEPNPKAYLEYLERKFGELYQL